MPVPDFSPGEVLTAAAMDSIGLWKVTSATVSAQPTLSMDNCFSANYTNYRVLISMNGVTNANFLLMRLLDSAGNQLVANYASSVFGQDYSSGVTTFGSIPRTDAQPLAWLANTSGTHGPTSVQLDIFNPFITTERTSTNGLHTGTSSGVQFLAGGTYLQRLLQERARGMLFFNNAGTNMTGTVTVYGYRD